MDLDPETWDNKTITSGLKNYLRSVRPTPPPVSLGLPAASFKMKPLPAYVGPFSAASDSQRRLAPFRRAESLTDADCALRPPAQVSLGTSHDFQAPQRFHHGCQ